MEGEGDAMKHRKALAIDIIKFAAVAGTVVIAIIIAAKLGVI